MLKISTKFGVAPQSFCENQNSVQDQDQDHDNVTQVYGVPRSVSKTVMVVTHVRAMNFSGKKQIGSHSVIDRYSGIGFSFVQKSLSL